MPTTTIYVGDCRDVLARLGDNSVDAIVTDPPYGLSKEPDMAEVLRHWMAGDDYKHSGNGFMGKSWDSFVPGPSVWRECLRVLKPGGHMLAFFGSRTYDLGVLAIRLAGFEIRDQIMWLYGSGFPKSKNLDGDWQGWGTALKPAHEPIVVARKPLDGTVAVNVLKWGTGAVNVDGCRVGYREKPKITDPKHAGHSHNAYGAPSGGGKLLPDSRWPANVIHDGSDEVLAGFPVTGPSKAAPRGGTNPNPRDCGNCRSDGEIVKGHNDNGGSAARFFYCAKASKKDRDEGNNHPTVKPTDLMRYLCRLVTPPGGTVLDPFMGSGSTGKAAICEGFSFIGIEMSEEYAEIARARIDHAEQQQQEKETTECRQETQLSIF